MRPLMPHQQTGFQLGAERDAMAWLMEMRLGKTLLCIRWVLHRLRQRGLAPGKARVLVVAPSTPLGSWMFELGEEGIPFGVARGTARQREKGVAAGGWTLTTYESVWRTPAIKNVAWDAVVLDESTAIKSPRAKVTRWVLKNLTTSPIRAILTGEIQPQSQMEVWPQMAFVSGGSFMGFNNYWKFEQAASYAIGYERIIKQDWRQRIKRETHKAAYVLTREQAGLGNVKVRETRSREMDPAARALYREVMRTWTVPGLETKHAVVTATWLRRIVGGHCPTHSLPCWKYDEVLSLLKGELANEQVVVWFAFNRELARMWRLLKGADISTSWVAGEVDLDERRRRVALFQSGKRRVMLAQIRCARMGVDMSAADTEIYFSNSWSFEDRRQSEDRIEHPKKKATLLVLDLVTKNTVDEDVVEAMQDRRVDSEWFTRKVMANRRMP